MTRTTKADVLGMFGRLVKTVGEKAKGWRLDYASCYGGYVIQDVAENGGRENPLGLNRHDAKTMYYIMHHQCMLLEHLKERGV